MKDLSFEEALVKMEEVVQKLEQGDLPLEEMIALYKEGMELSKICGDTLKNAEATIETLVKEQDQFVVKEITFEEE